MSRPPRFSVVVPTYNRGGWLVDALDSVFAQSFGDHEILVVDDGSTDDTRQRLGPYLERLRYLRKPNGGAASARNLGLLHARGEIVAFLDSDDRWHPDTLAAVASRFDARPDAGVVTIAARETLADGTPTERTYGKKSRGDDYTTCGLLRHDSGGILGFFVRRSLFDLAGTFDESLRSAEECDLCLRLSFHTTLTTLRRPLLLRRKHAANLSHDVPLNARCWIALLQKLAAARPDFVRLHGRTYRRALAKEHLRLGRELLALGADDPSILTESRVHLRRALAAYPGLLRAYTYLAWSALAPRTYSRWRARELAARSRLTSGRAKH